MTKWIISNCESGGSMHDVCQDHTAYFQNDKITVIALADGVSSSSLSDKGAKIATEVTCEEISRNFISYYEEKMTKSDFVTAVQDKIKDSCDDMSEYHQMKCTLLFCAIYKNQYLLGHIGDGAILYFGDKTRVISQPQENAVGGTATYSILDFNASQNIVFQKGYTDKCDGFLLTSDGLLGNVYYSSGTDVPQLAYDLFSSVVNSFDKNTTKEFMDEEFKAFLYENIQKDNPLADDCSMAIISRDKFTGFVDYSCENGFDAEILWPCICGNMNNMDEIRCSCCRKLYIDIYSDNKINIISKEGFFSRLNTWIQSDDKNLFDPDSSAKIVDKNDFNSLCMQLKKVHNSEFEVEQVRKERENKEDLSSSKSTNITTNTTPSKVAVKANEKSIIFEIGVKTGKHICHILKQCVGRKTDLQKVNEKRETPNKQHDERIIELYHNEMLEVAYQLGVLPIEYLAIGEMLQVSKEKWYIIETMFKANQYIDFFEISNDPSQVTRLYVRGKNFVIINSCNESPLTAYTVNFTGKNIEDLLHRFDFSKDLVKGFPVKPHTGTVNSMVLDWNWSDAVYNTRRDATLLFVSFCEELDRNGDNPFSHLASSEKISWIMGKKEGYADIMAFLLAKNRLYLIRSINDKQVKIIPIEITEVSNIIFRFLKSYILIN